MNELDLEATPVAPLAEILRPKTLDDVVGQAPLAWSAGWSAPPDACAWITWLDHLLGAARYR